MKAKSIFAASLLIAGVAIADSTTVETSYVLGVMPVTASGKADVILSIPWVAEGTSDATTIAVTNLVKTAGLTVGDTLTWYDNSTGAATSGKLMQWVATNNVSGVLYWTPKTSVTEGGNYAVPGNGKTIQRGQSVVLHRQGDKNATMYVVGQVGSTSAVTTTIAGNAYTLLAPPTASGTGFDLNSAFNVTSGEIDDADEIYTDVSTGVPLKFVRSEKKWTPSYDLSLGKAGVPAGRGFWYHRAVSGDLEISWSAPSTAAN